MCIDELRKSVKKGILFINELLTFHNIFYRMMNLVCQNKLDLSYEIVYQNINIFYLQLELYLLVLNNGFWAFIYF